MLGVFLAMGLIGVSTDRNPVVLERILTHLVIMKIRALSRIVRLAWEVTMPRIEHLFIHGKKVS